MGIVEHGAGAAAYGQGLGGGLAGMSQGIKARHAMDVQLEQVARQREQLELMLRKQDLAEAQTTQDMALQLDQSMRDRAQHAQSMDLQLEAAEQRKGAYDMQMRKESLAEEQRKASTALNTLRTKPGYGALPDDPAAILYPDGMMTEMEGTFSSPINPTPAEMEIFPTLSDKDQRLFVQRYEDKRAVARQSAMSEALGQLAEKYSGGSVFYAVPEGARIPEVEKLQASIAALGKEFDDIQGEPGAYKNAKLQLDMHGRSIREAINTYKVRGAAEATLQVELEKSIYGEDGTLDEDNPRTKFTDGIIEEFTRAGSTLSPGAAVGLARMGPHATEDAAQFLIGKHEALRKGLELELSGASVDPGAVLPKGASDSPAAGVPIGEWVQSRMDAVDEVDARGDKGGHLQAGEVRSLQRDVISVFESRKKGYTISQKQADIGQLLKDAGVKVSEGHAGLDEIEAFLKRNTVHEAEMRRLERVAPKTETMRRGNPGDPLN